MNFKELLKKHPSLNRYFPDLSTFEAASAAIRAIESKKDPSATEEEYLSIVSYLENNKKALKNNINYSLQTDAISGIAVMVGFDNFKFCSRCLCPSEIAPKGSEKKEENLSDCGMCKICCTQSGHKFCECGTHIEKQCGYCAKCKQCCKCVICSCDGCRTIQECDCKYCVNHCSCQTAPEKSPFVSQNPLLRKSFNSERLAGVEWEYNSLSINKYLDHWRRKWLGTIHRDESCGFEAVTAPMAGDNIEKCLSALGTALEKSNMAVNEQCSIHVHADARDYTWSDMFKFLEVYAKIEPLLYILSEQNRLFNRYCLPVGEDYLNALKRIDKKDGVMSVAFSTMTREGARAPVSNEPDNGRVCQQTKPGRRADSFSYCRRKGLNILPWLAGRTSRFEDEYICVKGGTKIIDVAKQHKVTAASIMKLNNIQPNSLKANGAFKTKTELTIRKRSVAKDTTIEFRIHANTTDKNCVINWTKLIITLVDWVAKSTEEDIAKLPKSAFKILTKVIAPNQAQWILNRIKIWKKNYSVRNRAVSVKNGFTLKKK